MFLVLTANRQFWKTNEKILFLGEWCKLYRDKDAWSRLDAESLPYHWDDRNKLKQDYLYVKTLYETYLEQLSSELNRFHGVDYSNRYWRILIGPWLCRFTEIFFERYLAICQAANSGKVTQTWLPPLQAAQYVPKDLPNFHQGCLGLISDDYNHYLYGRIIEVLGNIPFEIKVPQVTVQDRLSPRDAAFSSNELAKGLIKKMMEKTSRWIPPHMNRVVFNSSYLNFKDLFRLQWALGQLPYLSTPTVTSKSVSANLEMRKKIKLSGENDSFENLLREIIPEQIPTTYVESYADMHHRAMATYPKAPQIIYTTSACWVNDGFNFWTAAQTERGAKRISSQHGGSYGYAAWTSTEDFEISVCDRYLSWGWEKAGQPKVVPSASGQLAGLKPKITPNPLGQILWLGFGNVARYSWAMVSIPSGCQMLDYFKEQERFVRAIMPEAHKLLVRRLFPVDYGWDEKLRWVEMSPDLRIYCGTKTMYEQLNESRLCIGAGVSTPDLETLSRNYPTISFFNPKLFELRESAQPYFEDLYQAGIYHRTPESAAAKVNEVFHDPLSWWKSKEVQAARKRFCHRFARTSENWISEWVKEFKKLME